MINLYSVRVLLFTFLLLTLPFSFACADSVTGTVRLTIRDGDLVATSSEVAIPLEASTTEITPTGGTPIAASAQSVLAALETLAKKSSEFSITDLQYYPSYSEFFLNCLLVPAASPTPLCGQWQYMVGGVAPAVGMDNYTLHDGDSVFIYFGYPRKVVVDPEATAGVPFTTTAESYDPATNTYSPAAGLVVGITQPNPADPWSPLVVATSTSDASGQATFTLASPGDYSAGLEVDYYTPATPFSVVAPVAPEPPADTSSSGGGGGGGGGVAPTTSIFNTSTATNFLLAGQQSDGSFGSAMVSDWVVIALTSANAPTSYRAPLLNYFSSNVALSSATDYERHAMALEALGIDPNTSGTIDHIVQAFDGVQIGDPTLVNDDIFSIFPLMAAGYTQSDPLIQKEIAFIISGQTSDGSWGSVDLTSAAVQALSLAPDDAGVAGALARAKAYLVAHEDVGYCFGNSSSTSWALQAMSVLGVNTPATCLAREQEVDGGVADIASPQMRLWETAYAIPAALGKSWYSLLHTFSKPSASVSTGVSSQEVATSTVTSSPLVASTTVAIASSSIISTTVPTLSLQSDADTIVVDSFATSTRISPRPVQRHPATSTQTVKKGEQVNVATAQPAAVAASASSGGLIGVITNFFASWWHQFLRAL